MTSPSESPASPGLGADFRRLWTAQTVSAFGSRITRTALPIIAVKTLGEPDAILGLLAAFQLAPGVVLAMFAGGFVDRGRKRRILVTADLIRAALVLSLTAAWALGALDIVHVVIVGAGVGAATALYQITDVAFLPSLVGKRALAAGNARLEATEGIAEVAGPASAGALIAALGAPFAVVLDGFTYLWSAFWLSRIRVPDAHAKVRPAPVSAAEGQRGVIDTAPAAPAPTGEDFRVGLRTIFGHPQVRPLVLSYMVGAASGGFYLATYTIYCLRSLELGETTFGVIIAMGGIGALGGALLSRVFVRKLGLGRALIVTSAVSAVFALLIPVAGSASHVFAIALLCGHQFFGDGFAAAFSIQAVTLRQTVLPRDVLGRANAAIHVCAGGMLPIAALIAGAIAEFAGARLSIAIGMGVGLLGPVMLWPLRRLELMPEAAVSGPIAQVADSAKHSAP
jgi:Na+/melibiose symporter-like transporter